jgi:hypothetical protein
MSTYRKERNIITFNIDGVNGEYRLDLNSGILYGIKGNPIKTCPKKSAILDTLWSNTDKTYGNLRSLLRSMIGNNTHTSAYPRYVEALSGAEKLDALGIEVLWCDCDEYVYIGKHIKEFNTYRNERGLQNFHCSRFRKWLNYENAKKTLGSMAEQMTEEMYDRLLREMPNITKEELAVAIYYLVRGKMWEYEGNVYNLVRYFNYCRAMEIEPQKVNNFMREYCETKATYERKKAEYDDKRLRDNYEKHKTAFEFAYGDYVVVLPKSGQDIVAEGQNMHHCVGSYVPQVVENSCYIVFIRHKDTPDKCYLTCQVHTNGEIGQYYLAYDRRISTAEDRAFKEAFATHLAIHWAE